MQIKNLYKYGENNGYIVTPKIKNKGDEIYSYRLIAEDNKILINGNEQVYSVDTKDKNDWSEIDDKTNIKIE